MDPATRLGIYVLIVAGTLLLALGAAFVFVHCGRIRARRRLRQRRLLSPASSQTTQDTEISAEHEVILPVLPHPLGELGTSPTST